MKQIHFLQTKRWSPIWLIACILLAIMTGCKTTHKSIGKKTETACLASRVKLTIPHKDAVFTVNGTLKLRSQERLQISFLMPILRTEVARIDITPEEVLLVDRMGKRYVQMKQDELKKILPKKANFSTLEKILFKASQPNAKRSLTGKDLGISKLEKCRIELSDFSNHPFTMTPTQLSSRYHQVEPEELLEMLSDLLQ